ncbi:ATP-binding protein [Marinibacterium sp. SX1]|uniref:ATP-binding protein n=1 Tax=Marinibacterium sp. SX1 TaxID=3388424 RepID=UPI003D17364C
MIARLLPEGLAGRFLLLLATALIAANLAALAILSVERLRLDREAMEEREMERIVSLVPAFEAVDPAARRAIARDASTRTTRVSVDPGPLVREAPGGPRSRALTQALAEALPGRELRAAIQQRPARHRGDGDHVFETVTMSIRLDVPGGPPQWLNLVARRMKAGGPGLDDDLFLLLLGLSLVAVLGVSWLFLRRLTRPLTGLARATRAAGHGDRGVRLPETGPRELRDTAAAFNDMQDRISRFDAERMRTIAALGHDLRTPITSLRIRAELLDEDEAGPMIRTLDEMTVMADGLISYAKGAGDGEAVSPVDLAALLARLVEDRGATWAGPGAPGPLTLRGRPVALGRAFGNLVDNALRYGGAARITLDRQGDNARVRIEDDGPGIPPDRLDAMFEPFVRGEDSRSLDTGGAGLGLSIARNIILAHGGRITLANGERGGLCATVLLPA